MATSERNDFKEILYGRRSIRQYDPTVKISQEKMTEILREATLAPSSVNLQPWRFVVIESAEGKEKLAPLAKFNQRQVETSAAVIAIFGDFNHFEQAETIYHQAVEQGYMPQAVKEKQLTGIKAHAEKITQMENKETILIDGGLVAMQLMLVARSHGYETCPIGGFEKAQIAEVLGLEKERYVPIMLVSIGKGMEAGFPSVRLPIETIATWL
ncbi:nitroreductase family protein [Enterococcus sp. LJL98]